MRFLIGLIFLLVLSINSYGQLLQTLKISIRSNYLATFKFDDINEYNNGILQTAAVTIGVESSVAWRVNVTADNAYFQSTTSPKMPAGILSVGKTGQTLKPLTNNSTQTSLIQLATGILGNLLTSGNTFTVDYKASPGWSYAPGSYSIGVVYTITAL